MKSAVLTAALLGLLLIAAPVAWANEEAEEPAAPAVDDKDVVVATDSNWEETVAKAKFALVEFYAPWCGHCQSLEPHWAKAATALKEIDPTVVIAKVDATAQTALAEKFQVQGYPTIKWFVDGEVASDYQGPREADGIVKWVQKKSGPAAATVDTPEALAKQEEEADVVAVGYFKKLEGADYDTFIKVATADDDVVFVQTTNAKVAKAAGLSKHGVALITKFAGEDRKTAVAEGDLAEFIKNGKLPLTLEFNDDNSYKIFNSGIEKQALLVASEEDLKPGSKIFGTFVKVAKALKGSAMFVTVNLNGGYKDAVVDYFGLDETQAPIVVGFDMGSNKKYRLEEELTEEALTAWVKTVVDGTAAPLVKSEPIPENDMDGNVKIVVGKSFDDIVKDPKKDVLLEVYATWCGYCKALEPIYKKLADRFSTVDSVVIAKMEGTENEHADIEVEGFPTLLFYPANGGEVIKVEEKSLKNLTRFIKEHAAIKFELPAEVEAEHEAEADEPPQADESGDYEFGGEDILGDEDGDDDSEEAAAEAAAQHEEHEADDDDDEDDEPVKEEL